MPFETTATEGLRATLPAPTIELLGELSALADPTAVLVVAALFYWFVDHERGGFFVATTLLALSATVAAKQLLAMGRPPSELWLEAADGYGFPSGHSAGAAVIYGYLAGNLSIATERLRYAVATLLVASVGLSRVALGVHYPADVLAGIALGLAVLLGASRYAPDRQRLLFAGGALAALVAVVSSAFAYETAAILLGGTTAGAVAWPWLTPVPSVPRRAIAGVGALVLAGGVAFFAAVESISGAAGGPIGGAVVVVGGSFLLVLGLLATPHLSGLAGSAVDRSRRRQAQ